MAKKVIRSKGKKSAKVATQRNGNATVKKAAKKVQKKPKAVPKSKTPSQKFGFIPKKKVAYSLPAQTEFHKVAEQEWLLEFQEWKRQAEMEKEREREQERQEYEEWKLERQHEMELAREKEFEKEIERECGQEAQKEREANRARKEREYNRMSLDGLMNLFRTEAEQKKNIALVELGYSTFIMAKTVVLPIQVTIEGLFHTHEKVENKKYCVLSVVKVGKEEEPEEWTNQVTKKLEGITCPFFTINRPEDVKKVLEGQEVKLPHKT